MSERMMFTMLAQHVELQASCSHMHGQASVLVFSERAVVASVAFQCMHLLHSSEFSVLSHCYSALCLKSCFGELLV